MQRRSLSASSCTRLLATSLIVVSALAIFACGSSSESGMLSSDDYQIIGRTPSVQATSTATPAPVAEAADVVVQREVNVMSADHNLSVSDFETLKDFKLSKEYDVEGLKGAETAIYGFFGPDPYDRQEFEIRFYPDHETAMSNGVDFANEATGPEAVIASSVQRWDEGLVHRRACAGNTRGSHHSGKCDIAKYGDYIIVGNVVLLCQGKNSETALDNCNALYHALRQ